MCESEWVVRDWQLDGLGEETYADGSRYLGEFRGDKRHGLGVFSTASGLYTKRARSKL